MRGERQKVRGKNGERRGKLWMAEDRREEEESEASDTALRCSLSDSVVVLSVVL